MDMLTWQTWSSLPVVSTAFVASVIAFFYMARKTILNFVHAHVHDVLLVDYNKAVVDYKTQLFEIMKEDLVKNNGEIYEFGAGSGGSLQFYPKDIDIKMTAIDPNQFCRKLLERNLKSYSNISLDKFIDNAGEDMKDIPDNSVGLMLCTIVLCSVKNQLTVLREIKRVLKPGGKFYFMEHVAAPKGSWLLTFQNLSNWMWGCCFNHCSLNRDTAFAINITGFGTVKYSRVRGNFKHVCKVLDPHIFGYAMKS